MMLSQRHVIALAYFKLPRHLSAYRKLNMPLVSVAYIGLLPLVAATPVLLFFDNLIVGGAIQLYAAIGMMIVAAAIRPAKHDILSSSSAWEQRLAQYR
jgi:hypothetical protein